MFRWLYDAEHTTGVSPVFLVAGIAIALLALSILLARRISR